MKNDIQKSLSFVRISRLQFRNNTFLFQIFGKFMNKHFYGSWMIILFLPNDI